MLRVNLTVQEDLLEQARETTGALIGEAFASLLTPAQVTRVALAMYAQMGYRLDPDRTLDAARESILSPGRRPR